MITYLVWYLLIGTLLAEVNNAGNWYRVGEPAGGSHYLIGLLMWPIVVLYCLWKWIF